ncbi:FtsL-like putative cell division protein [Capnocytophaga canimorsus]|uniref:S-adenosyl-methyltransferase n=1 Tax=Capnocytophaga canimorsus TaxID=28188 RepID=A0A0B7HQ44_9FLAO|nr:FtsL-like putative cell division protein [Capnocytophaga canimorsus]ATA77149.1 S-adenosyl-methyltransferase [Capnocytophaga canimorsus]ATA91743.1 S-adenosyl-methyltransferase [Capnocytophaga canimorsus]ATA93904.1 S-adenosyl-methyltransferase [Capnocytophaga canimorsus]AWL78609.1 S-adenosyl-methyltransferase [Capnocytophaga canimorsus]AYW37220.1 S-adenosyl-methyltransferase [Capnocytophaga canimorsus]
MSKARKEIMNVLRGRFLVEGNEAVKNWTFILFLFLLGVVMISSSHSADRKVYEIAKLNEKVNQLKSEFVEVRSKLQKVKLESTLLEQLKSNGLKQSANPPQKIKVIVKE